MYFFFGEMDSYIHLELDLVEPNHCSSDGDSCAFAAEFEMGNCTDSIGSIGETKEALGSSKIPGEEVKVPEK